MGVDGDGDVRRRSHRAPPGGDRRGERLVHRAFARRLRRHRSAPADGGWWRSHRFLLGGARYRVEPVANDEGRRVPSGTGHAWLPLAHPVAPEPHQRAFRAAGAIKIAIYGFVRDHRFRRAWNRPVWWESSCSPSGAASALLGVLYALMEHDLKRLLAFHSVENIGIIAMALGAAPSVRRWLGGRARLPVARARGGPLPHDQPRVFNSPLSSRQAQRFTPRTRATSRNPEVDSAKRMPWTSGFFLLGSAAISALPLSTASRVNGSCSSRCSAGSFEVESLVATIAIPVACGVRMLWR
ncbi:MAG: hypothetical protein IPF82_15750 [Blastocatellia bacterium]|nr:hypothetical protein [Blastocatellia bacterium]